MQDSGNRYRLTDILWWTRQEDVFEEIALILDLDTADTSTPGWFQLRTKASKNILDKMSVSERDEIECEAERMQKEGLPRDVQRRYVVIVADGRRSGPVFIY
jgi:predicted phosphoribosyltransferase